MIDEFGVLELASSLVAIPSVNGDEGDLVGFLAQYLRDAGLEVELAEVAPGRPNLFALWSAEADARSELGLLFHAHTDTVPAHGMTDAFCGRVQNGELWGRGSVDQKGGLAAAAAALAAAARSGKKPHVPVGLAAVVDEESEHRGSMALVQTGLRARRAIVTEPSGLRVVVGCKGTVPLRVLVRGKAAHGCRPWLGINAVEKAMEISRKLAEAELPEAMIPGLPNVRGSISLGVCEGGTAYNIVPDRCVLWFDRRTVPGESQHEVLREVEDLVGSLCSTDPDLEASVKVARPDWNWEPIAHRGLNPTLVPPDSDLVGWASDQHQRLMGVPPERYFTDGYTEADFLVNDMGIAAVQYGPGESGLCHTDEERLDISQLITCAHVYRAMAEDAAQHS